MGKRQETPEWMESFFEAVYPEYTNLAVSIARGEEQILRDATRVIQELRAENARPREGIGGIEMTLMEKLKELNATTGRRNEGEDLGHWADREKRENMWVRDVALPALIAVAEAAVKYRDAEYKVTSKAYKNLCAALAKLEGEV